MVNAQHEQDLSQLRETLRNAPTTSMSLPIAETDATRHPPQPSPSEQALQQTFLATLDHEIRTPMNGLVGMTQMVLQSELSGKQREQIELAHESAKHLMNIINDVLDYSKIQAGHLNLELRACNPVDVMHQTLRSFYPQAGAKGLTLYYEDLPSNAPEVLLDTLRLRQIMSNLIGNAIKFTHQGFVQTSMDLSASDKAGEWLLNFMVQDSGIGFDVSETETLFNAFQKGAQITDPFTGAGLGLAISQELVHLMGGHMTVTSTPKQGSTFKFTIPCTQATEKVAAPRADGPLLKRNAHSLHLLVAEDHPVNMKLMTLLLDQMGHTYAKAVNGEEAVKLFAEQHFDLVLMDVMMPVMDGMTAMGHLRQSQGASAADTPIIMVTAYAMNLDRQRFLDAGANGYVSKPIDAVMLQAEIARLVPQPNT
jgi:signal transduction histidine kinase/CheY-like chemotaxis protein